MPPFELVLFSVDPELIRPAVDAGVRSVIVDWEFRDKETRQAGAGTEINRHGVRELVGVRAATPANVMVRINAFGQHTAGEIGRALDGGADELLLPMVRSLEEVESTLTIVGGRCALGILVETTSACDLAAGLGRLPLSRVYMGFNDLAIDRRSDSIFEPLVDGTLERVRPHFDVPFGFGGLTRPDRGEPIPCRLLISEMIRHDCAFSFLRRSFHRDVALPEVHRQVARLLAAIEAARAMPSESLAAAHRELEDRMGGLALAGAVS